MIGKFYGIDLSIRDLSKKMKLTREGVSLYNIYETAKEYGFLTKGVRITIDEFKSIQLPCIVPWNNAHFVVVYAVTDESICYANPSTGLVTMPKNVFMKNWSPDDPDNGIALMLRPKKRLYPSASR